MFFSEKISVVMSTYDTSILFLKEAVESILNQTFQDFEFIIVDDGSTNGSGEYLSSIQDKRIKIIRNNVNLGLTRSLNIGLRAAKGKYIARMDSDDIAFPDRFAKQYAFMESHPDVFVCGAKIINFTDEPFPVEQPEKTVGMEDMESYKAKMLFFNPGPTHPTAFINHEMLIRYHVEYDERLTYAQDYGLWVTISQYGQICILPEKLLYYRVHSQQISTRLRERQRICHKMITRMLLEQLFDKVTEEEIDFHYDLLEGCDSKALISKEADEWYDRILAANKIRHIYNQKKLKQRIVLNKMILIERIYTQEMSKIEKGMLLFRHLPFGAALKQILRLKFII